MWSFSAFLAISIVGSWRRGGCPVKKDKLFMREAMLEARRAGELGDIPIGAVVVHKGQVIARGFNRREAWNDPTAHAEVVAMRRAAEVLDSWRLNDCTLFVTLEPCPMCASAIVQSRVHRCVFGALDEKGGGVRSKFAMLEDPRFNHKVKVDRCLADECAQELSEFFANIRSKP